MTEKLQAISAYRQRDRGQFYVKSELALCRHGWNTLGNRQKGRVFRYDAKHDRFQLVYKLPDEVVKEIRLL